MKLKLIAKTLLVFFFGTYLYASGNCSANASKKSIAPDDYKKEWAKVDSLEKKGLTKSALETVNEIYTKAQKDNNAVNQVKAIIFRMKFESVLVENSDELNISKLEKEVLKSKYPLKPVLQSLLAESYWKYLQKNRYKFYNRSHSQDIISDDIATWDINQINNKIILNYSLSIEESDSLKKFPLNIYDDIIISKQPVTKKLRPSLYDFLAHRALDYFTNTESYINLPSNNLEFKSDSYFDGYKNFAALKIEKTDTNSLKYLSLITLQNLIAFHQNDKSPEALIDADLIRLKYIKQHAVNQNKDSLYFNALLSLQNEFKDAPCSAEISYLIAKSHNEKANLFKPISAEDFKWENKKALEICDRAIEKFSDSFGAIQCQYLKAQILEKALSFKVEKVNAINTPFKALVNYKNCPKIYVRLALIKEDKFGKNLEKYRGEELVKQFVSLPAIKEFELSLPDEKDYNLHAVEIKLPELPKGHYVVLIADNSDFKFQKNAVSYEDIWVSDLAYMAQNDDKGGLKLLVTNRETGVFLERVNVTLWNKRWNYEFRNFETTKGKTYQTDKNGLVIIPAENDFKNYFVELSTENDYLYSNEAVSVYQSYGEPSAFQPETFLFTDRAIYRPGQSVYFKGILIETDGKSNRIITNKASNIGFFDVNGQKISDLNLTSNEYGTIAGTFVIPSGLLTGQMRIGNEDGSRFITVEEYKRPKFEVNINAATGEYNLEDTIELTGIAKAYAGAMIGGAKVKYRVVRKAVFPRWWYYNEGNQVSNQMEILNESITTNENGEFKIRFKAIPDRLISPKSNPIFNYTIYTDVTDINGETQSTSTEVSVGYNSLIINAEIPEIVNKTGANTFKISTLNLNGSNVFTQVDFIVYKLKQPERPFRSKLWNTPDQFILTKEEYYAAFPHDAYKDEDNKLNWEKQTKVFEKKINTAETNNLTLEDLKNWESGSYVAIANGIDKNGKNRQENFYFTLFSDAEKTIPVNQTDWLVDVKTTAEPGENAVFIIGTKEKNVRVFYQTEVQNNIVSQEWIDLNNEQKKIVIPVKEEHRGNFSIHLSYVKNGRFYDHTKTITVPYTNKKLDITFETFRDKLNPGQQEEWKIKIKGKAGEKVAAEMMTTLYDASLDVFASNNFDFNIFKTYHPNANMQGHTFYADNSNILAFEWNKYPEYPNRVYDQLNWFGFENFYYGGSVRMNKNVRHMAMAPEMQASRAAGVSEQKEEEVVAVDLNVADSKTDDKLLAFTPPSIAEEKTRKTQELPQIKIRKNFNETAFFYPQLQTNQDGDLIIKFTIPEALTKWKMLGLAHTKDLKIGMVQKELITQKELMVMPYLPRFFREGDKMTISSKISNLSDKPLSGKAQLMFFDALTMKPIDDLMKNNLSANTFEVASKQSASVNWNIEIPEGVQAITYRIVASANNYSDGEEMAIPVLTNRMLVTEAITMSIRDTSTKKFTFDKLLKSTASNTLKNHKITLEFSANPAWYAIQALPYMMEYPYECTEQIFNRFYANSIASHIANSNPKIKAVFDNWSKQAGKETLLSNLEKNQELKSILIEETPWVRDAENETERKRRVALLFDLNKMRSESEDAKNKLFKMQLSDGGFSWFEGMPDDRYITQYIVAGIGHLKKLNVDLASQNVSNEMLKKSLSYMDLKLKEDYELLVKSNADLSKNQLSYLPIHYFYARSFFKDIPVSKSVQKAYDFYSSQIKKYWLDNSLYMQGMIALSLDRTEEKTIARNILKSLKEKAITNEEMGMYWKENQAGYYWHTAPIETQALLIEAFDEITNDIAAVDEMRVWLLKQKQTQDWKTTKATAEACYALLLRGTDVLTTETEVKIKLGNTEVNPSKNPDIKAEAGTGYFKTSWSGTDIKPEMGNISVSKSNKGLAWGAVYWQYFEQLNKITAHESPLKINKQLFLEKPSAKGPIISPITDKTKLQKGDKIIVRVEIRSDRNMDYVHLKDMRASCFEPINVLSQYKYQGGIGYYESTRDAATNFFISHLAKGTYVFEYPLRVAFTGNFSNGITNIQSMYAPEFSSHSEGIMVEVE